MTLGAFKFKCQVQSSSSKFEDEGSRYKFIQVAHSTALSVTFSYINVKLN